MKSKRFELKIGKKYKADILSDELDDFKWEVILGTTENITKNIISFKDSEGICSIAILEEIYNKKIHIFDKITHKIDFLFDYHLNEGDEEDFRASIRSIRNQLIAIYLAKKLEK